MCLQSWQTYLILAHMTHTGLWAGAFRGIDPASLQHQDYVPPGLTVLALAPIPSNLLGQ